MPSRYRCPLCNADDMIEYEKVIECPHCGRRWHKDLFSGKIDRENILSDQEQDMTTMKFPFKDNK